MSFSLAVLTTAVAGGLWDKWSVVVRGGGWWEQERWDGSVWNNRWDVGVYGEREEKGESAGVLGDGEP